MLQNSSEFNSLGGYPGFGGFGGGFGGIAPFGLFGLLGLNGRNGLFGGDGHRDGGGDSCAREAAILAAIQNSKDATTAGTIALAKDICGVGDAVKDAAYAQAIQSERNTNQLSAQATAFQVANDAKFESLSRQISADGDATRALINSIEMQNLRDELILERRRGDARELEININNSNTSIQAQLQAQSQAQMIRDFEHQRRFDALFSQQAKAGQDIIAVGSLLNDTKQTANPVNVKS